MKPMFRTRMKKMVTEFVKKKEDGSAAGAVIAVFVLFVLIVVFVVVSTHFGLTDHSEAEGSPISMKSTV